LQVGVQSLDDGVLRFMGRRHSAAEAVAAVVAAEAAGFRRIGIDLLYGLPGQRTTDWIATLDRALALPVDHLSCYQLTLEEGTPFGAAQRRGDWALPDENEQAELFRETSDRLSAAGWLHYEVSNFARGERAVSRHNSKYWNSAPYLGLGPSAHSFDGCGTRWWNPKSLAAYCRDIDAGIAPREDLEQLTPEQRRLETFFLGLRTRRGVDLEEYRRRFGSDLLREKKDALAALAGQGLLTVEEGFLRPTRRGLAVADRLAQM
jgi:oxygen-independent coproporphyrinogen-3 oxidase